MSERMTAIHEAAHGVAAIVFGIPLDRITIGRKAVVTSSGAGEALGVTQTGDCTVGHAKYCIHLYAGATAEAKYTKRALAKVLRSSGTDDVDKAQEHFAVLRELNPGTDVEKQTIADTRRFVRRYWPAIEQVAGEALSAGTIDGERVRQIIGEQTST